MTTHPTRAPRRILPRALAVAALASAALAASASCDAGTIPSAVMLELRGGFPADGVLSTDTGAVIQLRRAQLSVTGIELIACSAAGPSVQLRALLGPGVALAHTHVSPTHLGIPHVVDLLSATATMLGTLAPPAGSYCGARISLGPADADAEGLPDPSFIGTMFALGADVSAPMTRTIAGTTVTSLTTDTVFAPALEVVEGDEVHVELVLGDGTALDGLALGTQTDDELASALVLGAQTAVDAIITR